MEYLALIAAVAAVAVLVLVCALYYLNETIKKQNEKAAALQVLVRDMVRDVVIYIYEHLPGDLDQISKDAFSRNKCFQLEGVKSVAREILLESAKRDRMFREEFVPRILKALDSIPTVA